MITTIFIVGLVTCGVCGYKVFAVPSSWKLELAWVLGGAVGGALMIFAALASTGRI